MKRLYYILIITAVLLSCEKPISDFQSENFIKMFGSGYSSKGNDVIQLSEGGYLITGYDLVNNIDQMIYVAKIDEKGNLIWEKTYGIQGNVNEGKVVKEVTDGYIVAATSLKNGITYPVILKLDNDGNEIYTRELNSSDYSIVPLDILVSDNSIYTAGYSDKTNSGHTDFYMSKLDLNGNLLIGKQPFTIASNSFFKKIFTKNDRLLLLGTDGVNNNITINEANTDLGNFFSEPFGNSEQLVDAAVSFMGLFTLSTSNATKTKLSLLNDSYNEVWSYTNVDLKAKSVTCRYDGSVIICAEEVVDEISYIHFLKISNGALTNGDAYFKTFPGTVSKMIETKDKGYILIGSTNETYGMNIQLIKTDKDYFMLKK